MADSHSTTNSSRRRPRVLLGASGSVATVKVPELAAKLAAWAEVSKGEARMSACIGIWVCI